MIATDHSTASQTGCLAGVPTHRWRIASTTIENGLMSAANVRSGSGIEAGGTKAEEMNVRGNTAMNPTEFADSGESTNRPISAKNQEKPNPNSSSRPTPATASKAVP